MTDRRFIQRFQILEVLGDGGMGTVVRARDPQLERDVAIKVLRASNAPVRSVLATQHTVDLRGGGAKRDDLLHEARLMAKLSHPHVVPIFEVGLDDAGDVFVVMEYVAGEDLRHWLRTPRSVSEIMRVLAQAARGLAAAHERGIVHRDFKPDNVLIGADGRARVTDFGISKLAEPIGLVQTAKVAGTPKYMAPELWRGDPATAASDVFALGATCLEALGDAAPEPVRALAERGRAQEPGDRPPLAAMIAVLDGRAPHGARSIAAAAAAAVVLGGGVALAISQADDGVRCAPLAPDWDRAAVRESLGSAPAEDRERLLGIIDRRADEITALAREVCEAEHAERLTAAQAQQQRACLEIRAIELRATVDAQLAAKTDLVTAEIRFNRTSLPISCRTLAVTARDLAPLEGLYARLYRSYDLTDDKALVELAAIESAARTAGDRELAVKAAVNLGSRQRYVDQLAASDETYQRAYSEAMEIGSTEAATNALAERLITLGNSHDLAQTKTVSAVALDVAAKPTTTHRARLRLARAVGLAAQTRGETRASIEVLREALSDAEASDSRNVDIEALLHMHVAESMLLLRENIPEAIALAKRAVELARIQGEHTNNYGVALNMLSKAYLLHNDIDEALDYRRRALAVFTRIFPASHSAVIEARVDLGVALVRASQFEAAHAELSAAVELARTTGAMPRFFPWMVSRLAAVTADLGRADEASKLYEQALDLLTSRLGSDHPQTFDQRFNHAALLLQAGRLDEAARAVGVLEQLLARTAEPRDKRPALVRGWLAADLALARGEPQKAEALAKQAMAELTELGAAAEHMLAQRRLGQALVDQGRFAEARDVLEPAFAAAAAQKLRADDLAAFELPLAFAERGLGKRPEARARAERLQVVLAGYPGARAAREDVARLLAATR